MNILSLFKKKSSSAQVAAHRLQVSLPNAANTRPELTALLDTIKSAIAQYHGIDPQDILVQLLPPPLNDGPYSAELTFPLTKD